MTPNGVDFSFLFFLATCFSECCARMHMEAAGSCCISQPFKMACKELHTSAASAAQRATCGCF